MDILEKEGRKIDRVLAQNGIYFGMPLGAGIIDVETSSDIVKEFITEIEAAQQPNEAPEEDELDSADDPAAALPAGWVEHRQWRLSSIVPWRKQCGWVIIIKNPATNRFKKLFQPLNPFVMRFGMQIGTVHARVNFAIDKAEKRARKKLFERLTPAQRSSYALVDSFTEVGLSGVKYLIRRNRPTIAFGKPDSAIGGQSVALCALCLHPLAYYSRTFAGAMVPSDEALAHLLLIRQGEHFYWRKATQHPLSDFEPECGV
jgi:hypothetical protein